MSSSRAQAADGWPTVAAAIVEGVTAMVTAIRAGEDVTSRPAPAVWSPHEYACHLRDVLLVQRERVLAARRMERPTFDPMGRDERVEHDGYAASGRCAGSPSTRSTRSCTIWATSDATE